MNRTGRSWTLHLLVALASGGLVGWLAWPSTAERILAGLPESIGPTAPFPVLAQHVAEAEQQARAEPTETHLAELAALYHANGLNEQAEASWTLLHRIDSANARAPHHLAQLARIRSDQTAIATNLAEVVRLAPDYAPAWLQQADLAFKQGRYALAKTAYARRLQLVPGDPYARLGQARLALVDLDRDAAKATLRAIVADHPKFSAAHNLLAQLAEEEGDADLAQQHRWSGHEAGRFEEAPDPWLRETQTHCYHPGRLRILGMREYQNGRNDSARTLFERAVEVDPDDPGGYEILGDLYLKLGELERAESTLRDASRRFTAAGKVVPISVYLNIGDNLRQQGRPAEAVAILQEGVKPHPDSFELLNSLGVALQATGRPAEAMGALRAALRANPVDPDTNFNLATLLFNRGAREEAMHLFQQSLQLKPTYPQTLLFLATLATKEGRLDDARPYVERLYDGYSGVPEGRRIRAQWLLQSGIAEDRQGEREAAVAAWTIAYRIAPELPGLARLLGEALLQAGDFREAQRPLDTYRHLEPQRPEPPMLLARVYAQQRRFAEARRLLEEAARLATDQGEAKLASFCREMLTTLPLR